MFWARSSSAKAGGTTQQQQPQQAPLRPLQQTYQLSETRRNELLLAARANRVSWIDDGDNTRQQVGENGLDFTAKGSSRHAGASAVSEHCHQALESIASDLQSLFAGLEELKQRIIPNDIRQDDGSKTEAAQMQRTILQELREKQADLDTWRAMHERNTTTKNSYYGRDKEMVFLLAFQELLLLLKAPEAAEVVYQIQSFVKRFDQWDLPKMLSERALQDRPGGHVHAFIDKIVQQLRHHEKLQALLHEDDRLVYLRQDSQAAAHNGDNLLHEVLEAFLMEKVYTRALTPSTESQTQDDALHARLASLAFVDFHHLDLNPAESEEELLAWESLIQQLRQLPEFKSPRRKMDIILQICQQLTNLLKEQHCKGRFPSADEFLPGLIYLLLKANPRELKRNVNLILEYRHPSRLVSEPGYFFTHLVSSVAFLEHVNGSLLTITPEEFEEGLRKSKKAIMQEVSTKQVRLDTESHHKHSKGSRKTNSAHGTDTNETIDVLTVRARRLALMKMHP